MHVRQPKIAALVAICQLRVIEAHQLQDRRLKVVDVDRLFGGIEAHLVRCAVRHSGLQAGAGHEERVAMRVMVAADVVAGGGAAFAERRAAELGGPDHQRVLEHASIFQILDQRGDGAIHLFAAVIRPLRMSSLGFVPWKSQPQSKSWTKRTPFSQRRRASRQLLAKLDAPGWRRTSRAFWRIRERCP